MTAHDRLAHISHAQTRTLPRAARISCTDHRSEEGIVVGTYGIRQTRIQANLACCGRVDGSGG